MSYPRTMTHRRERIHAPCTHGQPFADLPQAGFHLLSPRFGARTHEVCTPTDDMTGPVGLVQGKDHMQQSHVIEIAGQFAGFAVSHEGKFRFVPVDARGEELEDSVWPSLPDMRRVVRHLLTTGHLPVAPSGPTT